MPETRTSSDADNGQPLEKTDDLYGMGYDLFPRRRGVEVMNWKTYFLASPTREKVNQYNCEKAVVEIIKTSPVVKVMISALNKAGCPINFRRHLNCEYCEPQVTGGYDPLKNQIVLCSNTIHTKGVMELVLFHELVHMFDYCTSHVDFRNIEHLACTEIRAANLTHCDYFPAYVSGMISRTAVKQQHQVCVFNKAMWSVMTARNVSPEEAEAAVKKVFKKCYADLEPIGRQMRRNQKHMDLAYSEAFLLGLD